MSRVMIESASCEWATPYPVGTVDTPLGPSLRLGPLPPGTGEESYVLATHYPFLIPTIPAVGNLTFSEIIWIVVIILIIFGPQRLPEMARKAGQFMAMARDAATALQRQITEEYGDAITPLKDVGEELKEVRKSLADTAKAAARDVEESTRIKDVTKELKEAQRTLGETAAGPPADPPTADPDPADPDPANPGAES